MRWLVTAMHIELEPLTSREGSSCQRRWLVATMNSCRSGVSDELLWKLTVKDLGRSVAGALAEERHEISDS
jgi:hypothetical protein